MTANLFLFLFSIATGLVVTVVAGLRFFSKGDAVRTLDTAFGGLCMWSGMAIGAGIALIILAFVTGKLTN